MIHSIAPPAVDLDATVLIAGFDAETTIAIPRWQELRAAAVTGGLTRPALRPGVDCPPVPRRGRHRRTLAARILSGLTFAVVLLVAGVAATCAVVFLASTP